MLDDKSDKKWVFFWRNQTDWKCIVATPKYVKIIEYYLRGVNNINIWQ